MCSETRDKVQLIEDMIPQDNPGLQYPLNSTWVYWEPGPFKGADPVARYKFNTIAGFWTLVNNLDFTINIRYIFMKEGILPRWEDLAHSDGAHWIISFQEDGDPKTDLTDYFVDCLTAMIGESLFINSQLNDYITGITCVSEAHIRQVRYWISNKKSSIKTQDINPQYSNIIQAHKEASNFVTFANLRSKPFRGQKKRKQRT